jgi:hypothetical protein
VVGAGGADLRSDAMTLQNPITRAVDKWFDAMQTLLSAQRSMVQFTLTTPAASLAPLVERLHK